MPRLKKILSNWSWWKINKIDYFWTSFYWNKLDTWITSENILSIQTFEFSITLINIDYMKIGFLIFALLLLFSLNGYIIVRGWQALPSASLFRPLYLVTAILLFLAMFAGMIFGNNMSQGLAKAVSLAGFTYFIIFCYLFLSFLLVDILRLINLVVHIAPAYIASIRFWMLVAT